jgi:hypothetical protein
VLSAANVSTNPPLSARNRQVRIDHSNSPSMAYSKNMQHQIFVAIENYIGAEHRKVTCVHVNDSKFEIHYQGQKIIVYYDPSQYIFFEGLYGNPAGYFSFDRSPDGIFSLVLKNRQPMDLVTAADHLVILTTTTSAIPVLA